MSLKIIGVRVGTIGALTIVGLLYCFFLLGDVRVMIGWWNNPNSNVMTAIQNYLPEGDFARFWYVGKLLVLNRLNHFGFSDASSHWLQATFQINILGRNGDPSQEWLYPPTMNILAMLFSIVPLQVSFFLWNIASLLAATLLLKHGGLDWKSIFLGLIGPASIQNFVMGQNGVLTGGLLVAVLLWCGKKPILSGGLAGLLCIKPQVGLILGGIFIQPKYFPAFAMSILSIVILVGLSGMIEGWQVWKWFIDVAEPSSVRVLQTPFHQNLLAAGTTVFFMARSFHADLMTAYTLQALSSAISLALTWILWRKPTKFALERVALTLCLSALISPYGYLYDLVGYTIGMAALFIRAPDSRKPIYALLWITPGYSGVIAALSGFIIMPLVVGFAAFMVWREMASRTKILKYSPDGAENRSSFLGF
ncbi:MAG: glycosyltransferase family 87 protein [Acidocella sp.]|nr:glycosyltransferase family 87 protein [Acidocella sp.]